MRPQKTRPDLRRGDEVDMTREDGSVVRGFVMDVEWAFDQWQVRLHDRKTIFVAPLKFVKKVEVEKAPDEEKAA